LQGKPKSQNEQLDPESTGGRIDELRQEQKKKYRDFGVEHIGSYALL
jgi:hypothetical protein